MKRGLQKCSKTIGGEGGCFSSVCEQPLALPGASD